MRHPANDLDRRYPITLGLILAGIVLCAAVDLVLDHSPSFVSLHMTTEVLLLVLSFTAVAYVWSGWMRTRRSLAATQETLQSNTAERDMWRQRAEKILRGLGEEIDRQLQIWSLTPAEKDTALLLLKGNHHREIASLLGKSERTVRQQAVAVYRKSKLSGRAELSAFFLEDLFLPVPEDEQKPSTP